MKLKINKKKQNINSKFYFTQRKKLYKLEAGEFTLKPPYMYVVNQVQSLITKLSEVKSVSTPLVPPIEVDGNNPSEDDLKKVTDVFSKILKQILEETENGKLKDLTNSNFRLDVAIEILNDFFSQIPKLNQQLKV